ncbi:MAG: PQQ-binding-like beta-propeller repeat protein [Actinomycetota bacterium]
MRPPALGACLRAFAIALLGLVASFPLATPAVAQEGWPMSGHDPAHSGTVSGPDAPYRVAWETPIGPVSGVAATEEVAIALTPQGIVALDPADGSTIWEASRTAGPAGVPAIGRGLVVYASSEGATAQLIARDIESGDVAWTTVLGSAPSAPTISGKTVVVGTRDSEVVALDLDDGVIRWRFETTGTVAGAPAIAEGLVVAAAYQASSGASTFYGIDLEDGDIEEPGWRFAPGVVGQSSGVAVADELTFAGTNDLNIRASRQGGEVWEVRSRDGFGSRQIPAAGEALILADRTNLYRLEPETGVEIWTFRLADLTSVGEGRFNTLLASSPAVTGTSVILGAADGTLSGIDVDSGHRIWRKDLGDGAVAPIAVSGDLIYAATLGQDGAVVALEHDPDGRLMDEVSETVLDVGEAILNFALAAAAVGGVILLMARLAVLFRREGDA